MVMTSSNIVLLLIDAIYFDACNSLAPGCIIEKGLSSAQQHYQCYPLVNKGGLVRFHCQRH